MNPDATFWDRVADKYAAGPIKDLRAYEYTLGRTQSYLMASDRVLELGCGTATTALQIAPCVGQMIATDFSAAMVQIGQRKAQEAGLANLTVAQADPVEGRLPDGPFDAVLAFNMMHLLHDPEAMMARVRGLLKPGGLFISKTACLQGPFRLMAPMVAVMRLFGRAPKVSFFSTRWLEAAVVRQGFEIIESGDFPKSPPRRYIVARLRG